MLSETIEHLYNTFATYGPTLLDEFCTCGCVEQRDLEPLRSKPLRELSADELACYSFKAMTTIGNENDYKYFLPRICELIAEDSYPCNIEIVLGGKLHYADFDQWKVEERLAVEQYLLELWRTLLSTWPHHEEVGAVLHGLASALGSLTAPLQTWAQLLRTDRSAKLHLANWICWGEGLDTLPGFWNEIGWAWNEVQNWLYSPETAGAVETAFVEWLQISDGEGTGYRLDEYRATIRRKSPN